VLLLTLAAAAVLRPELQPMAFLVDHCWRGTFRNGQQDTHCFAPALGGQHVRDRHSVVSGGKTVYEGETLYSWDGERRSVTYTYFNSQGGILRGAMTPKPGWLDFGDSTYVGADGRKATISTRWRIVDDRNYEAVTTSLDRPAAEQSVRYVRVD
jgi:hypothetical protein